MVWSYGLWLVYCCEAGHEGDDILPFHAHSQVEELGIAGSNLRQLEVVYAKKCHI
jgi:hypothetical protein